MNKLKEIGNKFYQEVEVVMLTTDKTTNIYKFKEINKLIISNHPNQKDEAIPQHLYFLSNEEIKEGDWCLKWNGGKWNICFMDNFNYKLQSELWNETKYKKIIATTDTSLTIIDYTDCEYPLPQPSKKFIRAYIKSYNDSNQITKVLVEYIYPNTINFGNCIYKEINGDGSYYELINGEVEKTKSLNELINLNAEVNFRLKVNSSNEITIKKIKEFYTREEVVELCKSAFITGTRENDIDYFGWERRNL